MRRFSSVVTLALWLSAAKRRVYAQIKCDASSQLRAASKLGATVMRPCECGRVRDWQPPDTFRRSVSASKLKCHNGYAGKYPCSGVDILSFIPVSLLVREARSNKGEIIDCWGWTDPTTKKEYAIANTTTGTSFIDITDPVNPIFVGKVRSRGASWWSDIKTYKNYAFIVSENKNHGLQVVELTQLRKYDANSKLQETAHYDGFGFAHNIVINEETGFAYVVGSNKCKGGLYIINIEKPSAPKFVGCYDEDGYTHDAQCVIYKGSDKRYNGREICFAENENTVTIVDVTDKKKMVLLSKTGYKQVGYTHQGWLTEDHDYLLFGDETDEEEYGIKTTTFVLNVKNLKDPKLIGIHRAKTDAIDHNMYVKGNYLYQANYRAGLRILSLSDVSKGELKEVGFFDVYPDDDAAKFNGAWSNYPYFDSGSILVSVIEQGVFVLSAPEINPPLIETEPLEQRVICSSHNDAASCDETDCCMWNGNSTTCEVSHCTRRCGQYTGRRECAENKLSCCLWNKTDKTCVSRRSCTACSLLRSKVRCKRDGCCEMRNGRCANKHTCVRNMNAWRENVRNGNARNENARKQNVRKRNARKRNARKRNAKKRNSKRGNARKEKNR
mmetsp:Transcript_40724/g.49564  ORF Transcript_40724/g.49564 Transcript_40724/m.49564 type:complete len:612 (+) Transcript_40724:33-1868(+)